MFSLAMCKLKIYLEQGAHTLLPLMPLNTAEFMSVAEMMGRSRILCAAAAVAKRDRSGWVGE